MKSPSQCRYCGAELPPRHVGRGKQKQFCNDSCRVMLGYRKKHGITTNRQRRERYKPYLGPPTMTEPEKAWMAAMVDGEGCICFLRNQKRTGTERWYINVALSIANTDSRIIQRAVDIIGAERTRVQERSRRHQSVKDIAVFFVERSYIADVLKAIKPYMVAKVKQADLAIEFCELHDGLPSKTTPLDRFIEMWNECKALNRRGRPIASGG